MNALKAVAAQASAQAKVLAAKAAENKAAEAKAAEAKALEDRKVADAKAAAEKKAAEEKAAAELAAKAVYERCPAFDWVYVFPVGKKVKASVTKGLGPKSKSELVNGELRCKYSETGSGAGYSFVETLTPNFYLIKKKQPKGPGFYDSYFTLDKDQVTVLWKKEGATLPVFRCDSELKYKYSPKEGDDEHLNSSSPLVSKWSPLKAEGSVKRTVLFTDPAPGPYQVGYAYSVPPDADFEVKTAIADSPYAPCEALATLPNFLHLPGFKCIKK